MQHHHISDETGFRLSFCELKVFVSGILMLYHMITGKELTINDLWQKNGIRETDIIEVKGQISSVILSIRSRNFHIILMIRKCVNWIVSVMEMWKCLTAV